MGSNDGVASWTGADVWAVSPPPSPYHRRRRRRRSSGGVPTNHEETVPMYQEMKMNNNPIIIYFLAPYNFSSRGCWRGLADVDRRLNVVIIRL